MEEERKHHHEHGCSCEHEHHEHEHQHEHECSCEHEHHEHHHDHEHHEHECCCGHEHHHEHHHDHDEHCSCGHHHEHGHTCACGHEHSHGPEMPKWAFPLAVVLFVLELLLGWLLPIPEWASAVVCAIAILLAGVGVFIDGFKNLFKLNFTENVLMSIAVITAFCMGEFVEAAAVAILFNLGEMAEEIAEGRARKSITELTEMRPDTARVLHDGEEMSVSPHSVKVGETIVVNPYERIPLDGVITEGASYVDNAALTGESVPVEVAVGDEVLSGGVNGGSKLLIRVTTAFEDSTASRILRMIEESSARKGSAEKLITRFARIYTPAVLVLAVIVAVLPPILGAGEFTTWLYRALTMLVASCPCALVISVPLGFFAGIGVESTAGMLIKGGKYLEALAKTDTVILDKTGTVTTGKLTVSSVWANDGVNKEDVLKLAAAVESRSTHPVAKAICEAAETTVEAENVEELAGLGIKGTLNGAELLAGRRSFLENNGVDISNVPECTVAISVNGRCVGAVTLSDTVKKDSKEAVEQLKGMGVHRVIMLTGDNEQAAEAVSSQVGITEFKAGLMPQDKAHEVEALDGVRVFVGDGVNDAPVLAAADCGIAIGLGSQAAIETADAVLSSGELSMLPKAIKLAKRCMRVIYFNIIFALSIKAAVLICTPLGFVPMWMGVFADVGVMALAVLNTLRILKFKTK